MSCIECDCGAKYDRVARHQKRVLGFQCRHCLRHWRTAAPKAADGQTELFFRYYECTCKSNILNIPPKNTKCICEVGDLR